MIIVSDEEVYELEFVRDVVEGFDESSLYEDYKEAMDFTDEQWEKAWATLENVVKGGLANIGKEF